MQPTISKKIISSLPTKDQPCVWIDYPTCVLDTISKNVAENHNCSLAFLPKAKGAKLCSNEVTLTYIKEIKSALQKKEYEECLDIKSCETIIYSQTSSYDFNYKNPYTTLQFSYREFIVEEFVDSYVYSFITIFSEIGGALGVLIGLSCMTIIDFFITIYKGCCKM